ncbi:hypothetical protein KM043_000750 [Ampulex compressa]|nr:hypothetical protein KM043_000750 [Ampulex compressa]
MGAKDMDRDIPSSTLATLRGILVSSLSRENLGPHDLPVHEHTRHRPPRKVHFHEVQASNEWTIEKAQRVFQCLRTESSLESLALVSTLVTHRTLNKRRIDDTHPNVGRSNGSRSNRCRDLSRPTWPFVIAEEGIRVRKEYFGDSRIGNEKSQAAWPWYPIRERGGRKLAREGDRS